MKVGVHYTVEVDEFFRRALAHHFDEDRLATREEIKAWFVANGESGSDDLTWDYQNHLDEQEREVYDLVEKLGRS